MEEETCDMDGLFRDLDAGNRRRRRTEAGLTYPVNTARNAAREAARLVSITITVNKPRVVALSLVFFSSLKDRVRLRCGH